LKNDRARIIDGSVNPYAEMLHVCELAMFWLVYRKKLCKKCNMSLLKSAYTAMRSISYWSRNWNLL